MATSLALANRDGALARDWLALSQRGKTGNDRAEDQPPILAAENRLGTAFGMRHHRRDIASFVDDSSDIAPRPVGIGVQRDVPLRIAVAQQHALARLKLVERRVVGEVVALAMRDGDA